MKQTSIPKTKKVIFQKVKWKNLQSKNAFLMFFSNKYGFFGFWIFWMLDFLDFLDFGFFGCMDFLDSGFLGFWIFWICGFVDFGCWIFWIFWMLDFLDLLDFGCWILWIYWIFDLNFSVYCNSQTLTCFQRLIIPI